MLDPQQVTEAPVTGKPGYLLFNGTIDAKPGDILALGIGDATPYGFLGKVKSVAREEGGTRVNTVPATLQEALPEGNIEVNVDAGEILADTNGGESASIGQASISSSPTSAVFWCGGSTNRVRIGGSVRLWPEFDFTASWRPFRQPESSFEARMNLQGSLFVIATGGVTCQIPERRLVTHPLPPVTVLVGKVPVVIVPTVTVDLRGRGNVNGSLSTGIQGEATMRAGLRQSGGIAVPTQSFDPRLTGGLLEAPDTEGLLRGTAITRLRLLLYGVAGPQARLDIGLETTATANGDINWALTAPVSLRASLIVPTLDADVGEITVFEEIFPLAGSN